MTDNPFQSSTAPQRPLAEIQSFWMSVASTVRLTDLESRAAEDIATMLHNLTLLVGALESEQQDSVLIRDQLRRLQLGVKQAVTAWKLCTPGDPIALLQLHSAMNALENMVEVSRERAHPDQVP